MTSYQQTIKKNTLLHLLCLSHTNNTHKHPFMLQSIKQAHTNTNLLPIGLCLISPFCLEWHYQTFIYNVIVIVSFCYANEIVMKLYIALSMQSRLAFPHIDSCECYTQGNEKNPSEEPNRSKSAELERSDGSLSSLNL